MPDEVGALAQVTALDEERRRYEGWIAQLEARRGATPDHVLQRVRGDYEARLREVVAGKLGKDWSPQQIAARLVTDYPDDLEMRVSHETIYRSLFVQARGDTIRTIVVDGRLEGRGFDFRLGPDGDSYEIAGERWIRC